MRHTGAGLTRRVSLALVAALVGALVFAAAVSAKPAEPMAPDVPNIAHCFYGRVTTELETTFLAGYPITIRTITGGWTGQYNTVSDAQGRYGWEEPLDAKPCVTGYDTGVPGSGAKPGDQIAFFVNGQQVLLRDVSTGGLSWTYTFEIGGLTHLNLVYALRKTITVTAGANGAVNPPGPVSVPYGGNQTFTFTPATGYQVDQVFVDEQLIAGSPSSYTFTNVRENHTLRVTFIRSTYNISVTTGQGCTTTPAGNQTVNLHGSIKFNVGAQSGYAVTDVVVDGASKGPLPEVAFVDVTGDHSFSVTCARSAYTIKVTAGDGCTITPPGDQAVNLHGNITFAIAPQTGYNLVDVKVDSASKGPLTEVTIPDVTADHTLSATCAKQQFTITPDAGANGKILPGVAQIVLYGDSTTFEIKPDLGYGVEDVLVNGESKGALTTYTFENVTANATIKATFKKLDIPILKFYLPTIGR